MPFTDAGTQSDQTTSAHWSATHAVNVTLESSTGFSTAGATTWPPSAASSSAASLMDTSATAPFTEFHRTSSPPTSHAASPSRTRSSPLRPSLAANVLERLPTTRGLAKSFTTPPVEVQLPLASITHTDAYVASSDPEDGTHGGDTDVADTPERGCTPPHPQEKDPVAVAFPDMHVSTDESSIYVQIPASSPSTVRSRESRSSKKAPKKQQRKDQSCGDSLSAADSARASSSTLLDDAAFAAALAAQEETLVRRRPTRNARKEVSYGPNCDLDGRPLPPRKDTTASVSSSRSKTAPHDPASKGGRAKRRSKAFCDDDIAEEEGDSRSAANVSTNARPSPAHDEADDADLTDDDAGFKARGRKKPRVSEELSLEGVAKSERRESLPRTSLGKTMAKMAHLSREEMAVDALSASGNGDHDEDGILTPPAPTSPRRSLRKGVPSPKQQLLQEAADENAARKKGKAKQQRTFAVCDDDDEEEEEEEAVATEEQEKDNDEPRRPRRKESSERTSLEEAGSSPSTKAESKAEQAQKQASPTDAPSTSPKRAQPDTPVTATSSITSSTSAPAPVSVAIKRISAASSSSSSPSSPSSPGPRSFFGKPLTTLLTASAVRRPGLTRKTKIPPLLNHRGVPKPPAPQLAASKRRLQDDDYEYDADYEALIAKNQKGSDEESDGEDARKNGHGENDDDLELEDEREVEYD